MTGVQTCALPIYGDGVDDQQIAKYAVVSHCDAREGEGVRKEAPVSIRSLRGTPHLSPVTCPRVVAGEYPSARHSTR